MVIVSVETYPRCPGFVLGPNQQPDDDPQLGLISTPSCHLLFHCGVRGDLVRLWKPRGTRLSLGGVWRPARPGRLRPLRCKLPSTALLFVFFLIFL